MDPNACLKEIIRHLNDSNYDSALDASLDLEEWIINKNGFLPTNLESMFTDLGRQDFNKKILAFFLGCVIVECHKQVN